MKKRNADALDKLLQQWGNRTAPDDAHRRELEMRVMRNTRECPHAQASSTITDRLLTTMRNGIQRNGSRGRSPSILDHKVHVLPTGGRASSRAWWAVLGAVAAVVVIAAFIWLPGEDRAVPPQVAQVSALVSPFSTEQIAARKLLFGELDDLFAGTLRWVSITDEGLQFDFGPEPVRAESSPVALRTVISKRSADGQKWVTVWQADVMLAPDEYVSLTKPGYPVPALGLWLHRLPDGAYIVHADIGDASQSSGSQMLPFFPGGDAVQTVCLDTGGDQYRLSQSLAELTKGSS